FSANASYLERSEGFLRLRLRNDMYDFNYRIQVINMAETVNLGKETAVGILYQNLEVYNFSWRI
ncbi:MAG: hypothetical protein KDJ65_33240, partial [Anaerolineae bacterium]|nr:hypothetical protein [Anaerolineae bacterium]